jgi:small multidrug resistance pump
MNLLMWGRYFGLPVSYHRNRCRGRWNIGSQVLRGSHKTYPAAIVVVGYAIAFYLLSLTLRTIPIGVAYAVCAGSGVALVTVIGWIVFGQSLDAFALLGIALIMTGALVIYLLSSTTVTH